ncbi:SgcJ/EcaC family oxidoreductase [Nocardia nova]|uniref:SgcJ/EcaC family oxidoreductase n=1 Tax=Nocardia nova TaxID=37330 RepID=UPI0033ECBC92
MSDSDLQEIRDVVARIEHAQRGELVEEFVSLFRADAVWTTGHGKRLYGRDAIAEFTAGVLPGATAEGTATYEVDRVLFLRPDVAAVTVRQQYRSRSGAETAAGAPMYVMTKEDGRWLLAANQNTVVVGSA